MDAKLSAHERYSLSIFRRLTGFARVLPDFLILGVQKAGTTTLYNNLVRHHHVHQADIKEVHYFDTNWERGENWYRAHFALKNEKNKALKNGVPWLTGEGSPYYIFHPLAPGRVKKVCPNARMIIILRNPVDRAYSHYHHEKRKGREPLTFEEALADEDSRLLGEADRIMSGGVSTSFAHQHYSYKTRGYYVDQLEKWFAQFPREQFLIIENSELSRNLQSTFDQVCTFLGIDPVEIEQPRIKNVGSYEPMNPETRSQLVEHFAPYNQKLYALLGTDYGWE